MSDEVADKHYWLDKDGQATTDESKGEVWLVREGSPISPEAAEKIGKVAQPEAEEADPAGEMADSPKANKAEKSAENKGVK